LWRYGLVVLEGALITWLVSVLRSARRGAEVGRLEARRSEEALRESEERFRLLVENIEDYAIVMLDPEGRIASWNEGAQRIKGYGEGEIVGEHFSRFYPEDEIRRGKPEHDLEVAVAEGRVADEGWRIRKDGSRLWASTVITALRDENGNLRGFSEMTRDITERRRNEDALRFLAEASKVLSVSLDYRERLARIASLAVPRLADWCAVDILEDDGSLSRLAVAHEDPQKVELAQRLQERYPPDPDDAHGVYQVLRTTQPELVPEIPESVLDDAARDEGHREILRELGLKSYMIVPLVTRGRTLGAITLVTAESGRRYGQADLEFAEDLAGRSALAVDNARLYNEAQREIVQRKRYERVLEERAEELARSNAELEQFAYVASHDLQEPLRMVSSYTQLLARRYRDRLDSDANEFIDYAVGGANRMQALINDLLRYSRLGTRGEELAPTDTQLVFDAACANLMRAIEESGAEITSDELPVVLGDRSQLVQLFQNLIGNAIKFRSEEPVRIHVRAERRDGEWLLSVRDNGIGIEPQYADRIFVIFQRLDGKTEHSGTGIGLAVCKKIVEHHGGRIWVESESGKGSTFYFTLHDG
jgi:PAS domain S-box-containing protein